MITIEIEITIIEETYRHITNWTELDWPDKAFADLCKRFVMF